MATNKNNKSNNKQAVNKANVSKGKDTRVASNQAKPRMQTSQNAKSKIKVNIKPKSNQLKTSTEFTGIVDDIGRAVDFGLNLADTVVSTVENPIDGLLNKVPNSIAKFADMVNNVSKPLVPNSSEKNQTVLSGPILKESKEEKFISALKQDVPGLQTTLIPSSYSPD
jgi:hypothetical protein